MYPGGYSASAVCSPDPWYQHHPITIAFYPENIGALCIRKDGAHEQNGGSSLWSRTTEMPSLLYCLEVSL